MESDAAPSTPSAGREPQVLVVDDDPDLRDTLRLVLEEDGYAVRTASTGADALAIVRASERPLVVVLDHHLRGSGGLAVLRALRADPSTLKHAVVYMSAGGTGEAKAVQAELAVMQVPYVRKPFDLDEFLSVVAKLVGRLSSRLGSRGPGAARPQGGTRAPSFLSIQIVPGY